jgi:Tfp pilus assembly protein FimT
VKQLRLRPCCIFSLRHRNSAFSLVELLLVVALMVVVAGLSLPQLPKHFSAFELDQTTRHLSYLMRYAQSLAVVHQKEYQLCFSTDRLSYWLEEEVENQDKSFQEIVGAQGKIFSAPKDIVVGAQQPLLHFYPDGTIDRARITLRNKSMKTKIISTQERRGQVDVFSPIN